MSSRVHPRLTVPRLSPPRLGGGWESAALVGATLVLLLFGLLTLWSASAFLAREAGLPEHYYVLRQATGAAIGLGILVVCAWIPSAFWKALSWPIILGTAVLLLLVVLPNTTAIAPETNGARRWLDLGVRFQPSEFAKLSILVWTAQLAVKKRDQFHSFRWGFVPFLLIWSLILIPVFLQPDFSTAVIIAALGATVVFLAGARITHFLLLGFMALPGLMLQLGADFRVARIMAFLNPAADRAGAGFQADQSLIAVGSGGVIGLGFGEGRQKYGFLPEPHNDFIFSMIGEEWGLVGVCLVVALYAAIVLIGFRIARRAADPFAQLLAAGLATLIALHAFLHMGVGLGLLPTTGLSLPLISWGRSNLVVSLAAIGMLMAISREASSPGRTRG